MLYGDQLKYLREKNEVTQIEISKIINVDQSVYSHYETEYNIMPLKHLITLANYFNVSIDYLFKFNNIKNYKNNKVIINNEQAGKKLKEFRKQNKLTQAKLASILNTTQSVIADYERGRYLIATPFLYTICKKYNISADYILGKTDNPKYFHK